MPVLSPFVIIRPPSGGKSDQPYSEVEYGRIIRSLMKIGGIPLAINYTPGQSILPENFEREALRAPSRISPIVTKAIDVLDRGIIVVPTRESVRLRGVRIPSQFSGSEASRAAAREAMRILREISRSGEIAIVPGVPVRDSSGAILVVIRLENGETLNSLLVREGLAMTEPSDFGTVGTAESAQLQRLQTEARRNRSGLWGRW
jgi:endonuclease YncB( thermonuclease family)